VYELRHVQVGLFRSWAVLPRLRSLTPLNQPSTWEDMIMTKGRHQSGDQPSDRRGRTWTGRIVDRLAGDGTDDRGTPEAVGGRRGARRATKAQTIRYGPLGGVRSSREAGARDIADRWRR
jgi:hypothetical protein